MGRALNAVQREYVARKFYAMKQRGEITYDDLVTRMSHTLRNPEWEGTRLAAPDSLHEKDKVLDAIQFALTNKTGLVNRAKSSDVLSTLTSSGQALIRTDLDPTIENIYLEEFPGWMRIPKIEANGVAHNYVVSTDFDAADVSFVSELDPAPKGQGAYSVHNAPIAIALTERGSSLKELYAVRQSGMRWNGSEDSVDLELERGTTAIAYSYQKAYYQGTLTTGHTGTDEYGTYYSNLGVATAFQGLRGMLSNLAAFDSYYPGYVRGNPVSPTNQGPIAIDQGNMTMVQAINQAVRRIMNYGKRPTAIHLSANAAEQLGREGANIIRLDQQVAGQGGVTLGIQVDAIQTVAGRLPLVIVPGDSIGSYTAGTNSTYNTQVVEDIYVLCERTQAFAFLGAPNMVTIEIPVGVDGTLGKRYLLFGMFGLVVRQPSANAKVRIPYVA